MPLPDVHECSRAYLRRPVSPTGRVPHNAGCAALPGAPVRRFAVALALLDSRHLPRLACATRMVWRVRATSIRSGMGARWWYCCEGGTLPIRVEDNVFACEPGGDGANETFIVRGVGDQSR